MKRSQRRRPYFVHPLLRAKNWQDRPELDAIVDWWRAGGRGVCALIGIGGAGKTSIADRFLRMLPGVVANEPQQAKGDPLPEPAGLFVFSFYAAPNPDSFFSELVGWLGGNSAADDLPTPSYEGTIRVLGGCEPFLIVLDGLEKVQELGLGSGLLGRISDGRLRDLILRAAEGILPASIVITSRFRLFDPLTKHSPFFCVISVEQIGSEAAVDLLRARGVQASSTRLAALAREYGLHALTIDLMGGFIGHFCGGNPDNLPPDSHLRIEKNIPGDLDPETYALREQEEQFTRVAARYVRVLQERDPVALSLMQLVCLFRLAVPAADLDQRFQSSNPIRLHFPAGRTTCARPAAD